MILVTGATAVVGNSSDVVRELVAAGQRVRALAPNAEAGSKLPVGVEIAVGDYDQPDSLAAAMRGIHTVYLRCVQSANMPKEEAAMIAAAKAAGVKHVVKQSILGVVVGAGITFGDWHRAGEQALEASGMAWTHLRACSYMSHTFEWLETIHSQGKIFSTLGDAKYALVHPLDVAAVACKVLTESGHEGKAYDVTGPEAMSNADQAQVISDVIGKTVEHVAVTDGWLKDKYLKAGIASPLIDALLEYMAMVRTGKAAIATDVVEKVTGKAPRSYAMWCEENATALSSGMNPYAHKEVATMPAYVIGSFVVHNPTGFQPYVFAVPPTIQAFGGEAIVADNTAEILEGQPGPVTVVIRFPSKEAARGWYDSAAYKAIAPIRHQNSTGTLVIVDHFVMPSGPARR